jgi:hypothetical protein
MKSNHLKRIITLTGDYIQRLSLYIYTHLPSPIKIPEKVSIFQVKTLSGNSLAKFSLKLLRHFHNF